MDHAEAREIIELAVVEPGGFERLMAGDTAEAARLAGHLAECGPCAVELIRARRLADLVGEAVRDLPSADLRERTLTRVAAVGRPRGDDAGHAQAGDPAVAGAAPGAPTGGLAAQHRIGPATRPRRSLRTLGAIAAVLIAVIGTAIAVSAQRDEELVRQAAAIERANQAVAALARVSSWSMRVGAESDASWVVLRGDSGQPAHGTILFARSTGDLVVVVSDLAEPPAGKEYRCWMDVSGSRRAVGRMFFGGGLAYWAGPVEALAEVQPGSRFGISLVDANGPSLVDDPVLSGVF
ncbi:MAG: anti-sigma factor [Chloroflexota bacterium]